MFSHCVSCSITISLLNFPYLTIFRNPLYPGTGDRLAGARSWIVRIATEIVRIAKEIIRGGNDFVSKCNDCRVERSFDRNCVRLTVRRLSALTPSMQPA